MRKTIRKSCVLLCPLLPMQGLENDLHGLVFLHSWLIRSYVFGLQTSLKNQRILKDACLQTTK